MSEAPRSSESDAPERPCGRARKDRRRRRRSRRVLLGVGAVLVLALGYGIADSYDHVPGVLTVSPEVVAEPVPQPRATAGSAWAADTDDSPSAEAPLPTDITGVLDGLVEDPRFAGPLGVEVADALTGDVLYSHRAEATHTPASTTKVFTAGAALAELGADSTLSTRALVSGGWVAEGSDNTEETGTTSIPAVHLVGGGDVLLGAGASDAGAVNGHAGLATLAADTAAVLAEHGEDTVEVTVDESRWAGPRFNAGWARADIGNGYIAPMSPLMTDSGYTPAEGDEARTTTPAWVAGQAFVRALREAGVTADLVGFGDDRTASAETAPAGVVEVAVVESAPVSALVRHMLLYSDNVVAEALGREISLARGGDGSAADAPVAVLAALADAGIDPGATTLEDTSGLDYGNAIAARDLVRVLTTAATDTGDLSRLVPGLPVSGLSGSLFERYEDTDTRAAAGDVRAKTGTLSTVNSLAGTVLTADGRLLVFAVLADGQTPGSAWSTRAAIDEAIAGLASCGCGGT
ncbi:D-alanyl-D-alanine carboxypeptidase/D-alanyl-D-alanine endopeptidase [Brevibacterium litoralis]|uniref:D-alanyl-D-alanine carboxypeptidase/D-alanyl-D-alanine endopeptidase n=1 Tax=Brevibacterium litoralis TaxID=3138935 RepID=UPI0032EF61A7